MAQIPGRLNEYDPGEFRARFKILLLIVLAALSLLLIRLWFLQVIKGDELRQRSENNSVRLRKIKPVRGLIVDRNRQVLVDNQPSFDILFVPNRTKDVPDVISKLERLYADRSMKYDMDLTLLKRQASFMPIKLEKGVTREKLAVVETHALELPGVMVDVVPVRKYFYGESLAQIIGYIGEISPEELEHDASGYFAGDLVGKFGIEKYLDPYLRGISGAEQVEVNVVGKEVRVIGRIEPVAGYNVVLTIDARLQKIAADALGNRAGAVAVMDPRDGVILAMVSSPSFDPNLFNGRISFDDWERISKDPKQPMENRTITGLYPPASTYKLVVAAAALNEGLIKPDTSILCRGAFELGNRTYRCWQKNGHGMVNLHRAIVESCDVYFYNLGKMIGVDKLAWYARQFGFGAPTGVDLHRERGGLIPTKAWKLAKLKEPWQMGETISLAIGQGFNLVTPLQLVSAYAALANGGTLWRPRIIQQIETQDGRVLRAFDPEIKGRLPLSEKNMELLRDGFWGAVNERGGTGYALKRLGTDVCGKTGTAQVVGLPEDERARKMKRLSALQRDHALFVCFAPCGHDRHPEIAVAVIVEHAGHGGTAAAPIARKVIDEYFESKKTLVNKRSRDGIGS
jgi:penicillin-binding protein 2